MSPYQLTAVTGVSDATFLRNRSQKAVTSLVHADISKRVALTSPLSRPVQLQHRSLSRHLFTDQSQQVTYIWNHFSRTIKLGSWSQIQVWFQTGLCFKRSMHAKITYVCTRHASWSYVYDNTCQSDSEGNIKLSRCCGEQALEEACWINTISTWVCTQALLNPNYDINAIANIRQHFRRGIVVTADFYIEMTLPKAKGIEPRIRYELCPSVM